MILPRAATPARRPGADRPHPIGVGTFAALVLALALLLVTAGPALAHGPIGLIQPQPPQVDGPLKVTFRLRLIYANDTDPVTSGATVTLQGTKAGGSIGPAPMTYEGKDGYYRATVTFPSGGTWRMTYTATTPAAQYAFDQLVTAPPTTPPPTAPPPTAGPAPTAPPVTAAPGGAAPVTPAPTTTSTTTASDVTTTTAPADSTTTTADLAAPGTTQPPIRSGATTPTTGELATSAIADQPSGGSGPLWALVAGGVAVAGGIAAAVVVFSGRRTPPAG